MAKEVGQMFRQAHFWTADKLDFLEAYVPAFTKATQKARARYYIDGFAGPGRNLISGKERDGSPLIALNSIQAFTNYFFVERQKVSYEHLKSHVSGHARKKLVRLKQGDFNQEVDAILPCIHDLAPCLVFLDPEGLELDFATVKKISTRTKVDLFILISGSGVIRNLSKPEMSSALSRFFGDEDWKPLYKRYQKRELPTGTKAFEAFTDLYVGKLESLGFNVCKEYLVAHNSKRAALHSLVFAIKSDKPEAALRIAPNILETLREKNQVALF